MSTKAFQSIIARIVLIALTCLFCAFSLILAPKAIAHALGQSYLYFQIAENAITARTEITVRDLNEALNLGLPADKKVRRREIEPYLEQIKAYVDSNLEIGGDSQPYTLEFQEYHFLNTTFAQFLQFDYILKGFQTLPDELSITYDVILAEKPQHTNLILIEENWKTGVFGNESNASLIHANPGEAQTLDLSSGSLLKGFFGVLRLGVAHIFTGVDHVLFLAALLLPSVLRRQDARWRPVDAFAVPFAYAIKLVAGFTVVHSLALWLAALQIATVPYRLAESITAAAIGLAAVEIFYPVFHGWMWVVVIAMGLFHGFGVANELAQLGATSQHVGLSLLGFNAGVALGQIGIVIGMLGLLYGVRTQRFYPRYVMQTGGVLLGAMSLYWFIEHAFNVNIRVLPLIQGLF